MNDLREQLAAIEHARWADWQRYFHSKCTRNPDGSLSVPAGYVAALEHLIETPYDGLTEDQKANDRREVDRYFSLIEDQLAASQRNVSYLARFIQEQADEWATKAKTVAAVLYARPVDDHDLKRWADAVIES